MASWNALPHEVRWMIFDLVAKGYDEDYDFEGKRHLRSGYAVVCRQWCYFFENLTFHTLVLDQDRIKDLQRMTEIRSRQFCVRHLWLRVKLDEYDCDVCQEREDPLTVARNSTTFTEAVVDLMTILAAWPKRKNPEHGLTLELSAFSPSDSKHGFKDFRLQQNYPYQQPSDCDPKYTAYELRYNRMFNDGSWHDPAHGWNERYQERPLRGAKLRLQGSLLFSPAADWESLRVRVVSCLLIRRQSQRKIPNNLLSDLVHKVCPLLEDFSHESWLDVVDDDLALSPDSYMVRRLFNLSSLRLFGEYDQHLHPHYFDRSLYLIDRCWNLDQNLSRTLCENTRHLERLAATSVIDARDLFSLFAPQAPPQKSLPLWWRLRSLAITSNMLTEDARYWEIENLFVAAGRAASRMPELETMEIWNGGWGHASIFRYTRRTETTTTPGHETSQQEPFQIISWKSTWKWGPDVRASLAKVARAWEQALSLPPHTIDTWRYLWPKSRAERIHCRQFAMDRLLLIDTILHPVSEYQIHWECYENREIGWEG